MSKYRRTIESGSSGLVPLSGLSLSDDGDGVSGRTLILTSKFTGRSVCAILRPSTSTKVYVTKFYSPIGGSVTIIQTRYGATISSDLFYTNGAMRASKNPWSIVEFGKKDSLEKMFTKEKNGCKVLSKTSNLAKLSDFIGMVVSSGFVYYTYVFNAL